MSSEDEKQKLFLWAQKCLTLKAELLLNTHTLTPVNYYTEKKKFLKSKNYNPIFIYEKRKDIHVLTRVKELEAELKLLKLPKELRTYLKEYLQDITNVSKVVESIGTDAFPYYAKQLFQHALDNLNIVLNYASIIEPTSVPQKDLLNAQEIAQKFKETLIDQYNIPDVSILLDDFNDHTIRVGPKRVIIGSKIKRKPQNVQRLIVHEIETHILQGYNLAEAQNPLLKLTKYADSLLFGEGMAVYNEHITQTITPDAFDTYFYRLKAVQMLSHSFREIFDEVNQYVGPEKAYTITARVKRGMHNTALPGGYPKDAAYLVGFHKIQEYINGGSNLGFLYIGKIPHLTSMLLRYNLLQKESVILPNFLLKHTNQIRAFHLS